MSFLEQLGIGLLSTAIWAGIGLGTFYFARKRLISYIKAQAAEFLAETIQFFAQNPQTLQPLFDSVMQQIMNRPGGIVPKEATIKLPIIGKVPASWFEPLIKMGVDKMMKGMPLMQKAEESTGFG